MMNNKTLTRVVRKLRREMREMREMRSGMTGEASFVADRGHRLFTPREAAAHYRIGRSRLMALVESGKLPAIRQPTSSDKGCRWRLRREDCDAVLENVQPVQ